MTHFSLKLKRLELIPLKMGFGEMMEKYDQNICMHILKIRLYSLQCISLAVKVEAMGREMRFFRNVSFQMENVLLYY